MQHRCAVSGWTGLDRLDLWARGVRYIILIEYLTVQETVLIQGNVFNFVNHKKEEEVLK